MPEMLALPFMQRALIGGLLVGALAGYYGVFVVQRGLSFLGTGLAHSAFGGVALGLLLAWEPLWVAAPFTIAVALAIAWVRDRTQLGGDTAIGIFFSVSMAFGVVLLSFRREYTTDAFAYLFGSILTITWGDLIVTCLAILAALLSAPMWSRWAYATFERELALADRLAVTRDDYILSVCLAVAIVVSVKLVGIALIASFLVIPPASARLVSRTFSAMTVVSILLSMASAVAGLVASYYLDWPSGPTIVLLQALIFFAALAFTRGR